MKKLLMIIAFLALYSKMAGQDMQYSQFYAAPLYINPAFTGSTIQHRFILNYRNQWPSIPGVFESYHASYEYNAAKLNSGFGLIFNREEAGSFGLTTDMVALSYAYRFRLNRKTALQTGLKMGYAFRGIDFDKLVFNDQLESNSSLTADQDAFLNENVSYPDISWGILLYGNNYWFGSSVNHINQPDQSLINEGSQSILPIKYTAQAGYRFQLSGSAVNTRNNREVFTAVHYKSQGTFDQLDLGAYYSHNPFVFGFWYRGIPIGKQNEANSLNHDAFVALVGLNIPDRNLRIGYSYDVTVSRLLSDSGGAHEISIIYEAASRRQKRKNRRFLVPCAKF